MGLLSTLLCCLSETTDSDKVSPHHPHHLAAKGSLAPKRNPPAKVGAAAAADKALAKDAANRELKRATASAAAKLASKQSDHENSINETETVIDEERLHEKPIEQDAIPPQDRRRLIAATEEDSTTADTATTGKAGEAKTANTEVRNESTADPEAMAAVTSAGAPTADVAPPVPHSDDDLEMLDLTKLQEGQAYNPATGALLGPQPAKYAGRKCLILDLDETLVHLLFKYLRTADFVIPVEIDNQVHHVYVIKRPGVDEFLKKVGEWYEVVVFTASVAKYGDPLLDKLDVHRAVHHRLFRDLCYNYQGNFIKNLSQVGRPLRDTIIIDNSPALYIFHPQHLIPISLWFSDSHDNELLDLLPILQDLSRPAVDDVGLVLDITL